MIFHPFLLIICKRLKFLDVEKEKFISVIKDNQRLIYKICYSYCSDPENRKDLQQEILSIFNNLEMEKRRLQPNLQAVLLLEVEQVLLIQLFFIQLIQMPE